MIIPHKDLASDTLNSIIESVVLREGSDYGEFEVSLEDKVADIYQQLQAGTYVLVYSEEYESVNIMPAEHFNL